MNNSLTGTLIAASLTILTACATSKSVKKVEDIADDGKRNTVVFTYDAQLYVNDRYRTAKSTKVEFKCPKSGSVLKVVCFNFSVPYRGNKEVDGYILNAFENTGARVLKMGYGQYGVDSLSYGVLVDRVPEQVCTYNKKKKRDECRTQLKDENVYHRANLPESLNVSVTPGTACYLGHLTLQMTNNEIVEYSLDRNAELREDRLLDVSPEIAMAVMAATDRPCS